MRKIRKALLGILTMMSGAILAVPIEAAERYIAGVYFYKAGPERLFSYPYWGLLSQEGEALVRQLLRPRGLLQLLGLLRSSLLEFLQRQSLWP